MALAVKGECETIVTATYSLSNIRSIACKPSSKSRQNALMFNVEHCWQNVERRTRKGVATG